MFEDIQSRPCIVRWFGMSHILFQPHGFVPIVVEDEDQEEIYPLDTCSTYEAAAAALLKALKEI